LQQNESAWQMASVHVEQLERSGPPVTHSVWLQLPQPPQSTAQLEHDSEASHVPSPQLVAQAVPHAEATRLMQLESQ